MGLLSTILSGGMTKVLGGVKNIIDEVVTTDDERNQVMLKVEKLLHEERLEQEKTIQAELEAKQEIIVAELKHGDVYTKRARPSILYGGLLFIFLNHVFAPILGAFTGVKIPDMSLPSEFWMAWTGICATYSIGRSMEKRGNESKITKLITG